MSQAWDDYRYAVDEESVAIMRGDFARGQRTDPRLAVAIGTFAHGQRRLPPPVSHTVLTVSQHS